MNTNERPALVIMAAGMGSRFGGMKQLTPVGPSGEFIIDYSIHDALTAGFSRIVFIIKRENEALFREKIGDRWPGAPMSPTSIRIPPSCPKACRPRWANSGKSHGAPATRLCAAGRR